MKLSKKLVLAVATAAALALTIVGAAVATGSGIPLVYSPANAEPVAQNVATTSPDITDHFAVFAKQPGAAAGQQTLRNQFGRSTPGAAASNADFDQAHSVPIADSASEAWIAPAGEKVCVFIPDPVDGFGATCATPEDAANGYGVGVLGPAAGSNDRSVRVAVIVPDGGKAPTVKVGGTERTLEVTDNVAAAVLAPEGELITDAGPINLVDMGKSVSPDCRPGTSCKLQ